jgi:hypothetical protein
MTRGAASPRGHEPAVATAVLAAEKRARFIQFLADPKRRREMLGRFDQHLPYLPEWATPVPAPQDYPEELEKLLRSKGAGATCHVMAAGLAADGGELPLAVALHQVCLQAGGAVLSCLPGRLAYYRPRAPLPGILLERP